MEAPLFSQIPSVVLKRCSTTVQQRKRIRFCEPPRSPEPINEEVVTVDDVSSSLSDQDSPPRQESPRPTSPGPSSPRPASPIGLKSQRRYSSDAILQVKPEMVSTKTQTDESYFRSCRALQQSSLALAPMYHTARTKGKQPPLKIGLSGLKRKKRKVFYPGEEESDD